MSRRRAQPGGEDARPSSILALLSWALDELGDELPAEERFILVIRDRLAAGDDLPPTDLAAVFNALGFRANTTEHCDLALALYSTAALLNPYDARYPFNTGNQLFRRGRIDEAIAAYGQALAVDPDFALASYNRGRLRYDSGYRDEGIDDFVHAARANCNLEGYHDAVARRVVRARGFGAMYELASDETLPRAQRIGFLGALARAISDAAIYGGWYLNWPVKSNSGPEAALTTLALRANLADILRKSPIADMLGLLAMDRTRDGYRVHQTTAPSLDEALWYRHSDWEPHDLEPDRVADLGDLLAIQSVARETGALEAEWAAHYMAGAIALSTLFGRNDWPRPVFRLAVTLELGPDNIFQPTAEAVAAIDRWIRAVGEAEGESPSERLASFASERFRAAARVILELTSSRNERVPEKSWLLDDAGQPITRDGEWVTGSLAPNTAAELWGAAEPVFREWVTTTVLGRDTTSHLAATARARQYNALTTTELWTEEPLERWRDCRSRIIAVHDREPSVAHLLATLGHGGLLVDYYVHEVVEDTVVRLALSSQGSDVTELPVETMAGDLEALLQAHRPGEMPSEGLSGRVNDLLLAGISTLAGATCLVIVPFGYLRNVPFHALSTIRDAVDSGTLRTVAYLPSTSFAPTKPLTLARDRSSWSARCLFVGFDASGDIDIDAELDVVRRAFPDVTVLRDASATPAAVLSALGDHEVAHFACHGDVDTRVRAGFLELAGAPMYAWDLLAGQSMPETVLLNACLAMNAGLFEPTSDAAFGLHTAFLTAGAAHVIGGLWEVNEWSARRFAQAFYEQCGRGVAPAAAVTNAQRVLRTETMDPFLWAPHAFFGDWR